MQDQKMNDIKVYSFDLDKNIFDKAETPVYLQREVNGKMEPRVVTSEYFYHHEKDIFASGATWIDNDPEKAFIEYRDTGPRWDKALLEDMLTGKIERSHKHMIIAVINANIMSSITARWHKVTTVYKAIREYLHNILSVEQKEEAASNIRRKYMNIKRTNELDQYLKRMRYYPVNNKEVTAYLKGAWSSSARKKALAMIDHIQHCEKNTFGYIHHPNPKKERGHSDDTRVNLEAMIKMANINKANHLYKDRKFTFWNTQNPTSVIKTTV